MNNHAAILSVTIFPTIALLLLGDGNLKVFRKLISPSRLDLPFALRTELD